MFLEKGNIELLWDIIKDEQITNMNKPLFMGHVQIFGDKEPCIGLTLFQMNTLFITSLLNKFKGKREKEREQPEINREPIKLKIQDTPTNYSITAEELHTERMDNFSKEFSQKQNEFTSMMTQNKPIAPNFSDTSGQDEPKIGAEMEQLIARTLAQRNFDIEQIHGQVHGQIHGQVIASKSTPALEHKKQISWSINDNIEYFLEEPEELTNKMVANEMVANEIEVATEVATELSKLKNVDSIFSKLKTINPNENIKKELKDLNDKLNKIMAHLNIL